jgi:hypothetical protein
MRVIQYMSCWNIRARSSPCHCLGTVLPQVRHQQAQQRVLQEQDDGGRAAVVLQVLLQDHGGAVPRQEAGGGAGFCCRRHVSADAARNTLVYKMHQRRLCQSCIELHRCSGPRAACVGTLHPPGLGLQRHCET